MRPHEIEANLRPHGNVDSLQASAAKQADSPGVDRSSGPGGSTSVDRDSQRTRPENPVGDLTQLTRNRGEGAPFEEPASGRGGRLQREYNRARVADAIHTYLTEAAGYDHTLVIPAYSRAMYMVDLIAQALAERQAEQGRR